LPQRRFARQSRDQLAVVVLIFGSAATRGARAEVPGTIVLIGDIPADGAIEAARQEIPAAWRIARLNPAPAPENVPPDESPSLARSYLDADFLRCLTKLQSTALDVDRLLERDRRDEATRVGTFAAACSLGAGDKPRARELVRRMFVRDLEDADTLRQTTPEFQSLVDEERSVVSKLARITVEVQTNPERATVHVDGVLRCRNSPCRVHLIGGEHIVVAERLGRRPRLVDMELDEDQRITLALDEAAADDVRRQLAAALAAGTDPTGIEISQAASTAFGARLLVMVWREHNSVHATAYDRAIDKLVTHVEIDSGPDSIPAAVRAAVHEEQGAERPRLLAKQPYFWLTITGVALFTGALVFMATRPVEVQHDIVFH
jgi:hypothetical protein